MQIMRRSEIHGMERLAGRRREAPFLAVLLLGAVTAAGCQGGPAPRETASGSAPAPPVYGLDDVVPASVSRPGPADAALPPAAAKQAPVPAGDAAASGDHPVEAGLRLFRQGRMEEAARELKLAADRDPAAWFTHYLLGLTLWKSGDLSGAARSLRASRALNGHFLKTSINLSRVLNEAGDFQGALEAAVHAVALDETSPTALYLKGRALANLGQIGKAETVLRASLALDGQGGGRS
ncbi:MAG: tetratricopeptide repeat protein [Acidobacteriota bacterium]